MDTFLLGWIYGFPDAIDLRPLPGDPREAPFALAPGAPERVQQPIRRPRVVEIAVDLRAQRAVRERVLAVSAVRVRELRSLPSRPRRKLPARRSMLECGKLKFA